MSAQLLVIIRSDRIEEADKDFEQFATDGACQSAGEYETETVYTFLDCSQEQAIREWIARSFASGLIRGADVSNIVDHHHQPKEG